MRRATLLALGGAIVLLRPQALVAQDPCPSASGPQAEAGWAAYQDGDIAAARVQFETALQRCDNDHYARTGLGYVALREGDTAEATALMATVVRAEPNNVDALVGLGLANWRDGDVDGVRRNFERVVLIVPDHPTALEYLERLAGAEAQTNAPRDPADQAWLDGDTELAFELYSDRLDENPEDGLALLRVGLVHAWSERFAASLELLDLLIDLEPTNIDGRLARARVYAWSGDTPQAMDEVEQILEVQPDNADARAALALFQSWSGQLDEALAGYDELMSIAPSHGAAQQQRAQALAWASEFEQSLSTFQALVEANPDDIEARLGLATALGFAGDYADAVHQYDQVLLRSPEEMRALAGKSKTLGWSGRLVDSERVALRAIEVDDASAEAWASLGQAYWWQGRRAEALDAFEAAARFAPANAEIRDQLRSAELSMAPRARPTVTWERDSDGNTMLTTSAAGSLHATRRLRLRASAYHRALEQTFTAAVLERTAFGGMVNGELELRPGWSVTAGLGGSVTDAPGSPSFLAASVGAESPERHPVVVSLSLLSEGLNETAALAERGVRSSSVLLGARWLPAPLWRADAYVSQGWYDGSETNGRREAALSASRRIGRFFSLGLSGRGFSFEKNLNDGYFDPDLYVVTELTSYWLYRPSAWTFLVELAPGIQKITEGGDFGSSLRTNASVGYRWLGGREVTLSYRYSSAGLTSFATNGDGYSYSAVILGVNWSF